MKVVDTNIIAYLLLEGDKTLNAESLFKQDPQWAAPVLWRSEFRSVLTFYLRKKYITPPKAREFMEKAEVLMNGNEYHISSNQVFDLIENSKCSAYDCEFVALARDLGISLVTNDQRILKEFPSYTTFLDNYR